MASSRESGGRIIATGGDGVGDTDTPDDAREGDGTRGIDDTRAAKIANSCAAAP
ncbi:hypothetical protein V3589_31490 [Sinorhizobium fredii]|uniref:hypothetical protein n=1 Tax=Rhizobium fredii TaxID=380 RepID=UPI0030B62946